MGRSPISEEIPPPDRTRSPSTIGEQLRISEISSPALSCQADNCSANLSSAKRYYRRHKVCEIHSKSASVLVSGLLQRFCQQCSRFHETSEFDEAKRSCRKRLAGHNERRRKICPELDGGGESEQEPKLCRRPKISFSQASACSGFQIR